MRVLVYTATASKLCFGFNMRNSTPVVTLAVPVYNCQETLHRCIDSLLGQSFQDFEVIIADNQSTDETPRIAREYEAQDHRIRYVRHDNNLGFSYNYNYHIGSARGRYIMCTGAKDWRPRDAVAISFKTMEADTNLALCYGKTIGTDGKTEYKIVSDDLSTTGLCPSKRFEKVLYKMYRGDILYSMMRLELLRKTRLLRNVYAHDHILMSELSAQGPFLHIQEETLIRCEPVISTQRKIGKTLKFIDPNIGETHRKHPYWFLMGEHLLALWHTPLTLSDKFTLTRRTIRAVRRRFEWIKNAD
jgi:glycosyltransferase involved in cell wall biosynthesis